jgi:hypothetical protein
LGPISYIPFFRIIVYTIVSKNATTAKANLVSD